VTLAASNLVHGRVGRAWMAVRDMESPAELIGIRLMLGTKLLAFTSPSYVCGVRVRPWSSCGTAVPNPRCSRSNLSFLILFMVIIGGLVP